MQEYIERKKILLKIQFITFILNNTLTNFSEMIFKVLKENSPHPPSGPLPLIQNIELVDELIEIVAALHNGSQIGQQSSVVTLSVKFWSESVGIEDRESIGKRFGFSHDGVVGRKFTRFNCFHVGQDDSNSTN